MFLHKHVIQFMYDLLQVSYLLFILPYQTFQFFLFSIQIHRLDLFLSFFQGLMILNFFKPHLNLNMLKSYQNDTYEQFEYLHHFLELRLFGHGQNSHVYLRLVAKNFQVHLH